MNAADLTRAARLELWHILHSAQPYQFTGGQGAQLQCRLAEAAPDAPDWHSVSVALPDARADYWVQAGWLTRVSVPQVSAARRSLTTSVVWFCFVSAAQRAALTALLTAASNLPENTVTFTETLAAHWRRLAAATGNPFIDAGDLRAARHDLRAALTLPPDGAAAVADLHILTQLDAWVAQTVTRLYLSLTQSAAGYVISPADGQPPRLDFPQIPALADWETLPRAAIEAYLDAHYRPDAALVRRALRGLSGDTGGALYATLRKLTPRKNQARLAAAHFFGLVTDEEYRGPAQRVRRWHTYAHGVMHRLGQRYAEGGLTDAAYAAERDALRAEGVWGEPDALDPLDLWRAYLADPANPDYPYWVALAQESLTPDELAQVQAAGLLPTTREGKWI